MNEEARVWVLMGSESDRSVMVKAVKTLKEFGVASRLCVASAHRSPAYLLRLIKQAEGQAQVFIGGAGGAAHLAGAIAAHTVKPVIGVPLSTKMGGLDSLLSTVQMPRGVPVATVAVDGAANAAFLALQILAVGDPGLGKRLKAHRGQLAGKIALARKA